MLSVKEQNLLEIFEQRAKDEGIEIVTLEIFGSKKSPTIRVYIDAPSGVSFDELATAQSWMGALLDRIDPFPGAYVLEVSSPGIDRPLRTKEHFIRFVGQTAVIKTISAIDGSSSFTGEICGIEDEALTVEDKGDSKKEKPAADSQATDTLSVSACLHDPEISEGMQDERTFILLKKEGRTISIPFDQIKRAHLKGRIDFK